MADSRSSSFSANGDFKEAVCIDGSRVFDSCCDRDCLEDLKVYFSPKGQQLINRAVNLRCKGTEVINVFIDVEPVHLNRGFYCSDITFYFLTTFDVFPALCTQPTTVQGLSKFSKKVILYGSEGKVKVFTNEVNICDFNSANSAVSEPCNDLPKCVVQCVDPLTLDARICDAGCCNDICLFPPTVLASIGGELYTEVVDGDKAVLVTIGLFTIVELIRNVQMLIPVYDYCIPEKECDNCTDNPCDVFSRLNFPTEDFFPSQMPNEGRFCNYSK